MENKKDIFDHLKVKKTDLPNAAYFEQLTKKVIEGNRVKVIPFYRKPITWISVAAAVLAILLLGNLFSSDPTSDSNPLLALNDCTKAEISAYIENNIHVFEADLLEEFVPEDSLELTPILMEETSAPIEDDISVSMDEIEEQDILDYFDEYEINPYDIEDDDIFI